MNSQVCVDINIALKLVVPETDSPKAQALWEHWAEAGTDIVVPALFMFEGVSVLCTWVQQGRILAEESRMMFQALRALQVRVLHPDDLHERAFDLALRFGQTQAYDVHYLALAGSLGCEFWTADGRLYRKVHEVLPWVRWLGEFQSAVEEGVKT